MLLAWRDPAAAACHFHYLLPFLTYLALCLPSCLLFCTATRRCTFSLTQLHCLPPAQRLPAVFASEQPISPFAENCSSLSANLPVSPHFTACKAVMDRQAFWDSDREPQWILPAVHRTHRGCFTACCNSKTCGWCGRQCVKPGQDSGSACLRHDTCVLEQFLYLYLSHSIPF